MLPDKTPAKTPVVQKTPVVSGGSLDHDIVNGADAP
jgi:hypothetical protein